MLILAVNEKTLFTKLENIYPECFHLISDLDKLFPLICLKTSCPRNANCMTTLAKRVKFLFDSFPLAQLLVLYFKYRDKPKSIRAGLFYKDLREPRLITMNPWGWKYFKEKGEVFEWTMPDALFL